jgi:hypothetical protein
VVTVVLPVVGALIAWAKDLNASARRARALDEAIKRVQLWDSWFATTTHLEINTGSMVLTARTELAAADLQQGGTTAVTNSEEAFRVSPGTKFI